MYLSITLDKLPDCASGRRTHRALPPAWRCRHFPAYPNPQSQLAHRGLEVEPHLGVLLP